MRGFVVLEDAVAQRLPTPMRSTCVVLHGATAPLPLALRRILQRYPLLVLYSGDVVEDGVVHGLPYAVQVRLPCRAAVLYAAVQRARALHAVSGIWIGPAFLDYTRKTCIIHRGASEDITLTLTQAEYTLVHRLARNVGVAVPIQTLQTELLGYHPQADTHTVENHVYRLRQKLLEAGPSAPRLHTGAGGYFLVPGEDGEDAA